MRLLPEGRRIRKDQGNKLLFNMSVFTRRLLQVSQHCCHTALIDTVALASSATSVFDRHEDLVQLREKSLVFFFRGGCVACFDRTRALGSSVSLLLSSVHVRSCVCCTWYDCSVNGTHSFRLFASSNERTRPRAPRVHSNAGSLFVARLISSVFLFCCC